MNMRIVFIVFFSIFLASCGQTRPDLTPQELEYINAKTVVVLLEENYYPFIYVDKNGNPAGISVKYLELISKSTGLKIKYTKPCHLETCLSLMRDGRATMITSVRPTPARSEYLSFSRPYRYVDTVLIYTAPSPKTIAVGKSYAVGDYLRQHLVNVEIREFDNDEASIQALIRGDVDAVALDYESAKSLKKQYKFDYTQSYIPYEYPLSFAVSKDNLLLKSILDKGITVVDKNQIKEINRQWK